MNFNSVIEEWILARLKQAQQGLVAKVVLFDKEAMRADVKPFLQDKAGSELIDWPTLPKIPVQMLIAGDFYIRPDYQPGDLVWVTFATHDIDDSLGEKQLPKSVKTFDLASACVVGGVTPDGWTPPTEFGAEDGLLIGHKDGDAYLKFESDKATAVFGTKKVEMSNGGVRVFDGAVWTNFMTHVHVETGVSTLAPTVGS